MLRVPEEGEFDNSSVDSEQATNSPNTSSKSSLRGFGRGFGVGFQKSMRFIEDNVGVRVPFSRPTVEDRKDLEDSLSGRHIHPLYEEERISFLDDKPADMTYSRRIALYMMSKYGWYNPRLAHLRKKQQEREKRGSAGDEAKALIDFHSINEQMAEIPEDFRSQYGYPVSHSMIEIPSLERAWAYFEHCTLSRYIYDPRTERKSRNICTRIIRRIFCKGGAKLDKAEPGENQFPTKLYHPIFTPHNQLGDFGLGIGLYFSNLRALCILTFLAGLFNVPSMAYYNSAQYSDQHLGVENLLKGTAVCTRQEWVPCEECYHGLLQTSRIAPGLRLVFDNTTQTQREETLNFALRNDCNGATLAQGMINLATLFFIMGGLIILNCYLQNMEVQYDEDEQTPQDYSVVINNPPADATDPEEWREFFREKLGARVTSITLAVSNDLLVRSLVRRREAMKKIEMKVPPGTELDMLALSELSAKIEQGRSTWQTIWSKIVPGVPEIFGQVVVLTAKVQGLAQLHYPVTNVYVIFETEADQRKVLSKLSVGKYQARNGIRSALPDKWLFRGQHVLYIREADEPDTIRWADLNRPLREKLLLRALTILVTIAVIASGAYLVELSNNVSAVFAATTIAVLNSAFPVLAKAITSLEPHSSESSVQSSLYLKITMARWVNTAIIISIITPFTATVDYGSGSLIGQIFALFFAEIVTTTLVQISDPAGHLKRHYLAPRASTQDEMDLNMEGQPLDIAERYTNMTKIFFLTLWYSAIYPFGFFMCAAALAINYFQDRISLMRTWKRAPNLGNHISQFSRKYFLSACVCVMALMSSLFWSGFPFDNLCENQGADAKRPEWAGNWMLDVVKKDGSFVGSGNGTGLTLLPPVDVPPANTIQTVASAGTQTFTEQGKALFDAFFQEQLESGKLNITLGENSTNYRFCSQNFLQTTKGGKNSIRRRLRFPFIPRFQPKEKRWMTDEQEILCNIYGWACVVVLGIYFFLFVFQWVEEYFNRFRSTYEPTGKDQKILFSNVPSISAYIPQVYSRVYSYPLIAVKTDGIGDLIAWTDPNRGYAFYDLTKDGKTLTERQETDFQRKSQISERMTRYSVVATKLTGMQWEGLSDDDSSEDDYDLDFGDSSRTGPFPTSDSTIRPASAVFPFKPKNMPKLIFSQVAYWPLTRQEKKELEENT